MADDAVTLAPADFDRDLEFLYRVYAGTRADEMALTGWGEAEIEQFLRRQFEAQHAHYQQHFPAAEYSLIRAGGRAIGRLYLDRRPDEIRIVDIALLPEERRAGIGGALLQSILDEAALTGRLVRIHVERNNPAMRLYDRLGFRKIEEQGVYWLMEWSPSEPAQANTA